jgi:DNA polymerase
VTARVGASIDELRTAASGCTDCELYRDATQTVFGEGPEHADLVLMGEVPGDQEDRTGHPFVGPAGKLLDRALADAGIDRGRVYVTNAVKHFKFRRQGKVRIHQKPDAAEIAACRQWWEAEVAAVRPQVLACLGATAAQAVFGARFRVTRDRGTFVELPSGVWATATIHPSAVLRAGEDRESAYAGLVSDLRGIAERMRAPGRGAPATRDGGSEPTLWDAT